MIPVEALDGLPTPVVAVNLERAEGNIRAMQEACAEHGVGLWPHSKTHKLVEIARRQLAAGAAGLTCAKIGEAEAMLPSGVKRIFIAHSLVDPRAAPRLRRLHDTLEELVLAVTSVAQAGALDRVLAAAGISAPVQLAVDTGLGREGARSAAEAVKTAAAIRRLPRLRLAGLYTHEGHAYAKPPGEREAVIGSVQAQLLGARDAIDRELPLWPGCSVTARGMLGREGVRVVRPGAYVFSDLYLTEVTRASPPESHALGVMATVVELPEPGLALIDAGSKVFSGDKTPGGLHARAADGRDLAVVRVNEEHGYLGGSAVAGLRLGDRIVFTPAHVCPVLNLTDTVAVVQSGRLAATWRVEARGQVT